MERFEALRCPYFKLGHVGTANETLHLTGVDNTVDLSVAPQECLIGDPVGRLETGGL